MNSTVIRTRLLWLSVFGIAFGYLEGSVVVYLRELYYPEGFFFPLVLPEDRILLVELGRELATLFMLAGVAMVSSRTHWGRFGVFCFLFGVWDIAYYIALRAILGWPESLFTWDVLFLIPRVWVGPVLSAVGVAVSLTAAGVWIFKRSEEGFHPRSPWWVWAGVFVSLILLLGSFMAGHDAVQAGESPAGFPWLPWAGGVVLGWVMFGVAFRKTG